MVSKDVRKRAEQLQSLIAHHAHLYHTLDAPEIEDSAYDALVDELRLLEGAHPELKIQNTVSERIGGAPLESFKKVKHEVPQWSFDNVFTAEELFSWDARVKKLAVQNGFKAEDVSYVCEHKIDGLKVILTYKKGQLVMGATRGDGEVGEDITENIKTIKSVPLRLKRAVDIIAVAEAWMPESSLKKINSEREKSGEPLFANTRNAAAGSLRQLDPKIAAQRGLDTFVYDIDAFAGVGAPKTQWEELAVLRDLGFHVNDRTKKCGNAEEILAFYEQEKNSKPDEYGVDGLVIKVDRVDIQSALGYTAKSPRFGVAFKFPAEQATTVVEDIVLQVGRTGVITPVARLRPVRIAGSLVSRATLHNEDEIKRLDIRIGDTVILQKAGDVIPDIVSVITKLRSGKEKPYVFPKTVDACGGDGRIERVPGQAAWRCVSTNSPEQRRRAFAYFVSKKALDIDGVGEKVSSQLLDAGLVQTFDDLFTLTEGDFLSLEGFAELSAKKAVEAIKKASGNVPLHRFIIALSINHVGEETARDLANHFLSITKLQSATELELRGVSGVGDIVARSVAQWFGDRKNQLLLKNLLKYITIEKPEKTTAGKLAGASFVFTGTLASMSREEAGERVRALGGSVSGSVSKKTSYVVVGADPGSKADDARRLGVSILTEDEYLRIVGA